MPVVVLTGLRQVGKSTLLLRDPALSNRHYRTLDDFGELDAARRDPGGFVDPDGAMTVDEAQRCPDLLLAIKRQVDRRRLPGAFLLSGSANFALLGGLAESLAGRAVYLTLHPLTRREIRGETAREPFLLRWWRSQELPASRRPGSPIDPAEVLRGGMPPVCFAPAEHAPLWLKGFEQTYLERDVRALAQVADLIAFRDVLRLAALRTAQILKVSEIARDAKQSASTVSRYLGVLETSFVIRRLPPFLRNRASRLIKSPKLFVTDAGIASHLAGVGSVEDPHFGAMLETYVAQNLAGILEAHWSQASMAFWSVQGRHEVDFIIEVGRDTMALEVKSAARWGDRDLAPLQAFLESTPGCRAAILAHNGREAVRLGERLWALPLSLLLS